MVKDLSTAAFQAAVGKHGTTLERPASDKLGAHFFDTTLNQDMIWNGTTWISEAGSACRVGARGKAIGASIASGQAVTITGYDNTNSVAELTLTNNTTSFANAIAVEDIALDSIGHFIMVGKLCDIDTSTLGWLEGDILYPGTDGNLTRIKPTSGNIQSVAYVLREHATEGALQIMIEKPQDASMGYLKFIGNSIAISADDTALALDDGTDNYNIAIGSGAGDVITSGQENILLGKDAGGNLTVENSKLKIANNATTALIDGDFTAESLIINGDLTITGKLTLSGVPTADPTTAGEVWNNSGVLTISAG